MILSKIFVSFVNDPEVDEDRDPGGSGFLSYVWQPESSAGLRCDKI
ncbi:hypothetical protein [Paenibacillus violae]|nr:hypothetical protein [Paenibacillus sp. PFR10]